MSNPLVIKKNPNLSRDQAIALAKAKAAQRPAAEDAVIMKYVSPEETKERIRIIFDDSGSMTSEIENAKRGVTEYMRNCIPNTTAVSVHFLCTNSDDSMKLEQLSADLPAQSAALMSISVDLGGTPLFTKMAEVVKLPLTNRMVAFTDGSPTDDLFPYDSSCYGLPKWLKNADVIIAQAIEKNIPIDTVFFGSALRENEIALLRYFADKTGGIFLHFDPAKVNFKTAFKYLAPVLRKALMSPSFKAELEAGKKN